MSDSATPWTVAFQTPLSMGFSRQEYWSGLPCPSPGDLSDPGTKFTSLISPVLPGKFFNLSKLQCQLALVVKNTSANAGDVKDVGSIPESGRSPGAGHRNPLQYSCLGNPMDRGAWQVTVHGVIESDIAEVI